MTLHPIRAARFCLYVSLMSFATLIKLRGGDEVLYGALMFAAGMACVWSCLPITDSPSEEK